ncbi:MAG: hypothetical protein LBQ90_02875 [Synergistaceae bacterium]|jgi:acyl-ACP thioesterase|nr:hypothetical protein [Synergistaceae bacterium]
MYVRRLTVMPSEVACTGEIKIRSLLDCLQDTAALAVEDLEGTPGDLMERGYAWVLLRYDLDVVKRLPAMDESFEVRTRHMPGDGFYTLRVFEVDGLPGSGQDSPLTPLVRAKTSWLLIDLAAGRPVRATRHLPEMFASDVVPIDSDFREIPRPPEDSPLVKETFFPVRFHDLDPNIHVNNAVYFEWAYEATPLDPMAYGIHSISAEFRVSVKWGDVVRVEARELAGTGPLREFVCTMWSAAASGEEQEAAKKRGEKRGEKPLARFRCAWEALQST